MIIKSKIRIFFVLLVSLLTNTAVATASTLEGYSRDPAAIYMYYMSNILFENLPSIAYPEIFSRKKILEAKINSYSDLYQYANSLYEKEESYLSSTWGITDQDELKAIFYMNFVSSMWSYGKQEGNGSGCNTHRKDAQSDFQSFLQYPVACCNDYAYTYKRLLDQAGLTSRLTTIPGHIFVEVKIEGKWMVFDPTTNLWVHMSFEDVNSIPPLDNKPHAIDLDHIKNPIIVTEFPNHNEIGGLKNSEYRSLIGDF